MTWPGLVAAIVLGWIALALGIAVPVGRLLARRQPPPPDEEETCP